MTIGKPLCFILSILFSFVAHWPRWMNSELEFLGTVMWGIVAFGVCWIVIFGRDRLREKS